MLFKVRDMGDQVPSTCSGTEDWLLRMVVMLFKVRDMGDQFLRHAQGPRIGC